MDAESTNLLENKAKFTQCILYPLKKIIMQKNYFLSYRKHISSECSVIYYSFNVSNLFQFHLEMNQAL